jgi:hypothetical protein
MAPSSPRRSLDLWSLIDGKALVAPAEPADDANAGVDRLLKSRSSRSNPPLKFVHKSATEAVNDAMTSAVGIPADLRVPIVESLIRQPQRFVELNRSERDNRRVAMAGAFVAGPDDLIVTAVGEVAHIGNAPGFESLEVEAIDIPDEIDKDTAGLLAEFLELVASDSLDALTTFKWPDGRFSRLVWCGTPASDRSAYQRSASVIGMVAGVGVTFADPNRDDRLALASSPEIMLLVPAMASRSEGALAKEFERRGGRVLVVDGADPAQTLAEARVQLHQVVQQQLTKLATAPAQPQAPEAAPPRPPSVRDTVHADDQGRVRGITRAEINEVLGDRWTRPARATRGATPSPGSPIIIGLQPGAPGRPDQKDVLLGVTKSGRFLHLVVVRTDEKSTPMTMITGWDPDAPENAGIWRADRLRPTTRGEYELPPTSWVVP